MAVIGLHDADRTNFPNLCLMKLSSAYKAAGFDVSWYDPGLPPEHYSKVVSAKIFTFTTNPDTLPESNVIFGGYGYADGVHKLPDRVEHSCPDYSLYGLNYSLGFLTRGCIRKCSHCFVPLREGAMRRGSSIEEFVRHKDVVLMDNNVLGSDYGIEQLDRIIELGLRVDFNQGIDARLIDDSVARRLGKVRWLHPVRMACDSDGQVEAVLKATKLLRWHNCTPSRYFCYVLVTDVASAVERIKELKGAYIDPFAQPYIDMAGTPATIQQKQLARWCNHKAAFKKCTFEEYVAERGDRV